jgi:DNA-binding NtrC family response regulator
VKETLESLVAQMHRSGILYSEGVSEFKKAFISVALREYKGNLSKAAPALGLHRNTLTRICFELQLDTKSFRPSGRRPPKSIRPRLVIKHSAR